MPDKDEYLRERYELLGQELTRLRIAMGYNSVREMAEHGPLSEGMLGRLERGKHINYERSTIFAAEGHFRLVPGSIDRFIAGRTSKLQRTDDPLYGLSDAEVADLRRRVALLEGVNLEKFREAAEVFMRNRPALAKLEATQRTLQSVDFDKLQDAAETVNDVLSRLAAG